MPEIFDGFALAHVCRATGFRREEVEVLTSRRILLPENTALGHMYHYSDLLVLGIVRCLGRINQKFSGMKRAHEFLKHLRPQDPLRNFKIYINNFRNNILYVGSAPTTANSAEKYLRLISTGELIVVPVGRDLEDTRLRIAEVDREFTRKWSTDEPFSLDDFQRRIWSVHRDSPLMFDAAQQQ